MRMLYGGNKFQAFFHLNVVRITERLHDNKLLQQLKFELVVLGNSKRHNVRCYTTSKNVLRLF